MKFTFRELARSWREVSMSVALHKRWRVLFAAIILPLPTLIEFFRTTSLDDWTFPRAITFALLLTIWVGIIAYLISPFRNWRMFQVVLMALSCLILGLLAFGLGDLPPVTALLLGGSGVLLFIAAIRFSGPSVEDLRLVRMIEKEPSGYGHVSWWIQLLAYAVLAITMGIPVIVILVDLYEMMTR